MLTSSEISSLSRYGDNKQIIKLMKESGFDAYDFSMFTDENLNPQKNTMLDELICKDDYVAKAKEQRKFADDINIVCNQTHAPFPTFIKDNNEFNNKVFELTAKAIEVSGILGAKCCVIHPNCFCSVEQNKKFYTRLEPYAKDAGIKIALENMFARDPQTKELMPEACTPHDNFKAHLDVLDERYFGACVDIGHAQLKNMRTDAATMIKVLGKRVIALHVHDNDCGQYDRHQLPFTMNVNYDPIIDALAESGYDGDITLEAVSFLPKFPIPLYRSALKLMASVAEYIRDEVVKRKQQ